MKREEMYIVDCPHCEGKGGCRALFCDNGKVNVVKGRICTGCGKETVVYIEGCHFCVNCEKSWDD